NPQRGFDCSGLMSYVHKNAGLKIPRTTAQQRDNSRTIDYAQLQAGDMLFFKTGKKTNHVGMYIGNRKFIHAPSSGKHVTVASMDSSYWHKRFVKFGTYLN
ncbi:MAG TPA: NlpC/P60 family protein, partial [Leucothrix sp.]|nr:NlpC/P60 family protein [Leucothrix sp.]